MTTMNSPHIALEVQGVSKSFGKQQALDNVSLQMEHGSTLAVLGPNGAGKSTLVRIISTLLTPDSGDVHVAGMSLARQAKDVRQAIGLASQTPSVDEALTARENLDLIAKLRGMNRSARQDEVPMRLGQVGLLDAADRRVKELSGGMHRRLDLAASLIGSPKLLILDEPTTGLDPRSRSQLWDLLRDISRQETDLLLTTQYLDEADALADEIVIVDHGHIVAQGSPDSLKSGLGRDIIAIRVNSVEDLKLSAEAVRPLAEDDATVDTESKMISVPVSSGTSSLLTCAQRLNDLEVEVEDVSLRRPTLDEVFLSITGGGEHDDQLNASTH